MTAWQASPDAPGLWWVLTADGESLPRWVYTDEAGLWWAQHPSGRGAHCAPEAWPGAQWARCVPPADDAEITALRARVEALEAVLREVCEAHRAEMIGPPGHAGAACDWCYPGGGAARAWPCESAECPIGRAFAALRSAIQGGEHE